jgi:hypothetical protein
MTAEAVQQGMQVGLLLLLLLLLLLEAQAQGVMVRLRGTQAQGGTGEEVGSLPRGKGRGHPRRWLALQ